MRSFKKISIITCFIILCVVANHILNYCFIPNSYTRMNVHNIETKAYDDIFIGTSRGAASINPAVIDTATGRKSTNICSAGEYLRDSYYLLKHACKKRVPRRVIYELDPSYWVVPETQSESFPLIYQTMSFSLAKSEYFFAKIFSSDFRGVLFPWFYYRNQYNSVKSNISLKKSASYKNYDKSLLAFPGQSYQDEGFIAMKNNPDAPRTKEGMKLWDRKKVQKGPIKYFEKLVKFCRKMNIELIVITTPAPRETLEEYKDIFQDADEYFTKMTGQYDIPYYNFNYMQTEGMDRSLGGYTDYDGHMVEGNAERFSNILGELLCTTK